MIMDITGFMFGNVNKEGELENEDLSDLKDSVASLSRLGVGGVLGDLVGEEEPPVGPIDNLDESQQKSPTAHDFADIDEVAEDDTVEVPQAIVSTSSSSERLYQVGVAFAQAQMTSSIMTGATPSMTSSMISSGGDEDYDDYDEDSSAASLPASKEKMASNIHVAKASDVETPATQTPSTVQSTVHTPEVSNDKNNLTTTINESPQEMDTQDSGYGSQPTTEQELDTDTGMIANEDQSKSRISPSSQSDSHSEEQSESAIPALIPDNMSLEELRTKVKKLFPGFKHHGILRFSSLLGPGKPSSLPRIWREAKKPKKRKRKRAGPCQWTLNVDFEPPPEMVMSDDEDKFLSSVTPLTGKGKANAGLQKSKGHNLRELDPATREWRFGPAKVWYDMIGVSEDGSTLDYGFKLKQNSSHQPKEEPLPLEDIYEPPDDAFLMVTQQAWEDKVLYDVPYTPGPPMSGMGGVWRPASETTSLLSRQLSGSRSDGGVSTAPDANSLFPLDNYELVYHRWEDDVIWDSDAVDRIPPPSLPRIDPNDPNFILGIPEEPPPLQITDKESKKDSKKPRYSSGRSKTNSELLSQSSSFLVRKDPFNLSNDEYYNPKHVSNAQGLGGMDSNVVQHSTPSLDLYPPWFPTQLSSSSMKNFHRPKLRIRCARKEQTTGYYTVTSLNKHVAKKAKEREKERVVSGGGEVFFMRTAEDLSVCDGRIVLAECSEQYPPLVNRIGLATKIKNYYRRPERQVKSHAPEFPYGETTYVQNTAHFLGQLKPGETLQSFENNLYRSPVYEHITPTTDFLLVIAGDRVHLREVEHVFVAGQQCPKIEVPAPNSKPATQFQRELLQVYLYRLFRENNESPKRIKMDVVRKAFPQSIMSESVIRKVLKICSDFKREGYETGWWVLRSDFRLPTEEEVRSMITPEQVCAYHSMLAAEHRLKEAGYRGKSLFSVEEEEEDTVHKVDDEVRAAPWNTTHHFINAYKGKYQLSVSGPADPTGCGEGFSYTRLNTKRESSSSLPASKRYKNVMGTDGDLRKLKLSKAKTLLRNFGVKEDEISKLSRWQVIDKVRECSTEAARSGDGADVKNLKFARGARFSHMESQERYREDCQRVFELQNSVLSSSEVLSTDEESSGDESDHDELGRNLETLLRGKKTSAQLTHEQEEAERLELRRLLSEEKPASGDVSGRGTPVGIAADNDDTWSVKSFSSVVGRHLVISRTYLDEEGTEYVRDEVVKKQDVINAYVRLSNDVRSKFVDQDEQTREDMKKEKRKIQDQLRRLKKIEEKAKKKAMKPQKPKPLTTIRMKCSACGQKGHMKTNRNCPMYKNNPINVVPTDQELAQVESSFSQDDLVKVEGTKVVLNRAVVDHANDVRRKSLLLKFPKDWMRKKRRRPSEEDLDYLERRKSVQRRKTNPEVPFSDHLEKIVQTLIAMTESFHFRKPVNTKVVPDYYNVIKFPMDLQTMRDDCRMRVYKSREQFWEHINLIVTNCITYNGSTSEVTKHAQKMLETCEAEFKKVEVELDQLETEINPALDDNALVALAYVLGKSVEVMKAVPDSWPFHQPVSAKKIPDYHKIIKKPMDLQTIKKNCSGRHYMNREQFIADVNQIVENSITYNGPQSPFTQTTERMREAGLKQLEEDAELLGKLESRLSGDGNSSTDHTSSVMSPHTLALLGEDSNLDFSFEGSSQQLEDDLLLFQDLQHSSSSSESDSQSDMDED